MPASLYLSLSLSPSLSIDLPIYLHIHIYILILDAVMVAKAPLSARSVEAKRFEPGSLNKLKHNKHLAPVQSTR